MRPDFPIAIYRSMFAALESIWAQHYRSALMPLYVAK
jgi:hypothetical protein